MDVNAINPVNGAGSYSAPAQANEKVNQSSSDQGQNQNKNTGGANKNEAAVFESSGGKTVYKPDANKIKEMWSAHQEKVDSFRRLIEGLLNKQAEKAGTAGGTFGNWNIKPGQPIDWNGPMMEIPDEVRAAAQKEIDEGGYFSIEETAKRILNFAVALSGGDPGKIDLLRDAAMKGFEQAEKMWGKELPEISYKTMEAVKKGFDEWKAAGNADAITLLNRQNGSAPV